MQLTFTPAAARKLRGFIAEKSGNLAVRIRIRRGMGGNHWSMTLEPTSGEAILVSGVPVLADLQSQSHLDGLVIDWVQTPEGQGFGIYDGNLARQDLRLGAD